MIIFNNTSAEIKTGSQIMYLIENDHNFDRTEDWATVFLKGTDFRSHDNMMSF